LKKALQGFPGAAIQIRKKIPVVGKIPPQDLRDAENEMPVGNLLENEGTEPLMIGRLRVPGTVNGGRSG
jgi:hypothetical protein